MCLRGTVSVSASLADTSLLSWAWQRVRSPVSDHLSVQLECSLYKRHPSVSLEWFLFTVHLLFFLVFLSYFFLPESNFLFAVNFGIPKKTLNNGIEMTWFIFYWNPIKLLMSSCSLFHCHFSPLLPLSIGTDPRFKKIISNIEGVLLKFPICLTSDCYL